MPTPNHTLLPLLGIFAACGLGAGSLEDLQRVVRREFPGVEQVSVAELAGELAAGEELVLLDVRTEEEFAVSHLAGAELAPDLDAALVALGDGGRERAIVTYCAVGYRSSRLAEELERRGFTSVRNLEGSIFAWANAGQPVVRDGRAVREVHPFDRRWGRHLERELWAFEPRPAGP